MFWETLGPDIHVDATWRPPPTRTLLQSMYDQSCSFSDHGCWNWKNLNPNWHLQYFIPFIQYFLPKVSQQSATFKQDDQCYSLYFLVLLILWLICARRYVALNIWNISLVKMCIIKVKIMYKITSWFITLAGKKDSIRSI